MRYASGFSFGSALREAWKISWPQITKAARVSSRELMPPSLRYAKAERVHLPGSIAVTFGTFSKLFDRRGLYKMLRSKFSVTTIYCFNDEAPDD